MRLSNFLMVLVLVFSVNPLEAISLVYNLKIRRVFSPGVLLDNSYDNKSIWVGSAVPTVDFRKEHVVEFDKSRNLDLDVFDNRRILASLFNSKYISPKNWWVEGTTALVNEWANICGTQNLKKFRADLDDIVFHGGYNIFPNKDTQVILYGLVGFPTGTKLTPIDNFGPLAGTRLFATGFGSEVSYSFVNTKKENLSIIFQNRFIHFFDRKWEIIAPCARFQPGNVTDLLLSGRYRKESTIFESGYNATVFTNEAILLEDRTIETPNFIRNSIYGTVSKLFKKMKKINNPGLAGAGFSVGTSKRFDYKSVVGWAFFTIIF